MWYERRVWFNICYKRVQLRWSISTRIECRDRARIDKSNTYGNILRSEYVWGLLFGKLANGDTDDRSGNEKKVLRRQEWDVLCDSSVRQLELARTSIRRWERGWRGVSDKRCHGGSKQRTWRPPSQWVFVLMPPTLNYTFYDMDHHWCLALTVFLIPTIISISGWPIPPCDPVFKFMTLLERRNNHICCRSDPFRRQSRDRLRSWCDWGCYWDDLLCPSN